MENNQVIGLYSADLVKKNYLGRQSMLTALDFRSDHADVTSQLFLRLNGPTTVLLQSRASRLKDVLTTRDVNEIADVEPGTTSPSVTLARRRDLTKDSTAEDGRTNQTRLDFPTHLSVASVGPGGKVTFKDAEDFKGLGGR